MLRATHPPLLLMMSFIFLIQVIEPGNYVLLVPAYFGATMMALDFIGRLRDYLSLLHEKITNRHILVFRRTWCGREVIKALYPEAREIYRNLGYRWYHITPDGFWCRHSVGLTVGHWFSLIGKTHVTTDEDRIPTRMDGEQTTSGT